MRALFEGGFHPVTMQQYVAYVHGRGQSLPSRPILLTFDDGRRDAYFAATPILRQSHAGHQHDQELHFGLRSIG